MPTEVTLILRSIDDTDAFARALAEVFEPGDIVILSGDLGAGKTTLTRSIAAALGVNPGVVSSPTFTVLHAYDGGRIDPVYHIDAYRLAGDDESELIELGWEPAGGDAEVCDPGLTLIEWGERIERVLREQVSTDPARLTLTHAGETTREALLLVPEAWTRRSAWAGFRASVDQFASQGTTGDAEPEPRFETEREQLADLYHWLTGSYRISRPAEFGDEPED